MASIMASTLAGSRPSEKLGTHSTSVLDMARRITGGSSVRQLERSLFRLSAFTTKDTKVHQGSFFFVVCLGAPSCPSWLGCRDLTGRLSNRQTAKSCGVRLDSPA